jgi:DNA-directed RNA polymerase specialized sigma24 family protein
LSVVMLVLLESLSPEQRAVLLLHDVFDFGHAEIAAIVGKSEGASRSTAARERSLSMDSSG